MNTQRIPVGVVVERRVIDNPWVDHVWDVVAVLPGIPATADWTSLEKAEAFERFYMGSAMIELHATDTAQYRDNLVQGAPRLWVVLRETGAMPPLTLIAVTADPAEGEAHTENGDSIVGVVSMPADIAGHVAAYVETHHVERAFVKRKRDRLTADGMGRRRPDFES